VTVVEMIIDPFTGFAFMRRALAACVALSVGGAPLGAFMILRRMTLAGDAMSHALLPGVAVAFLAFGLSLGPMTAGGLIVGFAVAAAVVLLTRTTLLKEDAALTLLYLLSLAAGVTLVSLKGSHIDLMHLLFGNILALGQEQLVLMSGTACVSLFGVALLYRWLVIEGFDPNFLKAMTPRGGFYHVCFYGLLMLNLVAAFQALGTLMALGLVLLPVLGARFWARTIDAMILLGVLFALVASFAGLLVAYHANLPLGPAVVLAAGGIGLLSALFGRMGSVRVYWKR